MNYYYLDENRKPVGPLPLEEIRRKTGTGEISTLTLVAAEGGSQWQPLAAAGSAAGIGVQVDNLLANGVAAALRTARSIFNPNFITSTLEIERHVGQYAIIVSGVLGAVYTIYAAVKEGSFVYIGSGVLTLIVLACALFITQRFFGANEALIAKNPSRISSQVLPESAGLLALLAAVATVIGAVVVCCSFSRWQPLEEAVPLAAFWVYLGAVALNPGAVNVEVASCTGGEETIGLVSFFLKALLKILPLWFCVVAVLGAVGVALSFFSFGEEWADLIPHGFIPLPPGATPPGAGFQALASIISACFWPALGYVGFIACSLPLDLWRSILLVPQKLDGLKR
ncbi:MAG TPA: DUF4339 domain-containing protein [Opitutaceae bacterium]|nr:DUF4339 domain-containing protein [Opitutaceae bacterium]